MHPQKLTYESFVDPMLVSVPELRPVVDEHLKDCEEILPHILMGDITRFVIDLHRRSKCEPKTTDEYEDTILRTVRFLVDLFTSSDTRLQNLVSVSFLENLDQAGRDYAEVKRRLTKPLLRELRYYESQYGWPESI